MTTSSQLVQSLLFFVFTIFLYIFFIKTSIGAQVSSIHTNITFKIYSPEIIIWKYIGAAQANGPTWKSTIGLTIIAYLPCWHKPHFFWKAVSSFLFTVMFFSVQYWFFFIKSLYCNIKGFSPFLLVLQFQSCFFQRSTN